MVAGLDRLERSYLNYQEYQRRAEMIDTTITLNLGKELRYLDNETPLYVNPQCGVKKNPFQTDLVYGTRNRQSLLFVEETLDPCQKKDQLIGYCNITDQTLKMVARTDAAPSYDVFLVFPQIHRGVALSVYKEAESQFHPRDFGHSCGLTLWQYSSKQDALKCIGGKFSRRFSQSVGNLMELKGRRFPSFQVLKRADVVSILIHILLKACESEYVKKDDNIEFTREKVQKWMTPSGLMNEERWKEALKIGEDVGLISDYSSDQLTGTINYTKPSSGSITILKKYTSSFFEAIRDHKDDASQTRLDFFPESSDESTTDPDSERDID